MNFEQILRETESKMRKAIETLNEDLSSLRAGRANPAILEGVKVQAYGSPYTLKELGSISSPEPSLLMVTVWDAQIVDQVVKGIQEAALNLNPSVEGNVIRVSIPPITEERRGELIKVVGGKAENARVRVRQVRHEVVKEIEEAESAKEISKDDKFKWKEQIQKLTDKIMGEIDNTAQLKEKELAEPH